MLPETFNRVSNALRLYHAAQRSAQPDFALLGFIGCLESLFSVATQELSFRLCLTISKFSRDTSAEQRAYFVNLKRLYAIRSKIAHGDKLTDDEERAAIQLVEHWVPTAAWTLWISACGRFTLDRNVKSRAAESWIVS